MRSATAACIDQRDDAVQPESVHQRRMGHDRLQHGRRIGKAGGFDDDARQPGDPAGLQPVDEVGQRIDKVAAHRAAEAAVGKLDDAV